MSSDLSRAFRHSLRFPGTDRRGGASQQGFRAPVLSKREPTKEGGRFEFVFLFLPPPQTPTAFCFALSTDHLPSVCSESRQQHALAVERRLQPTRRLLALPKVQHAVREQRHGAARANFFQAHAPLGLRLHAARRVAHEDDVCERGRVGRPVRKPPSVGCVSASSNPDHFARSGPAGQYTQMYPRQRRKMPPRRLPSGRDPMANNEFIRTSFAYSRKGLQVDKWSRILFPLGFLLFNMFFWGYYLIWIRRNPDSLEDFDGPGE